MLTDISIRIYTYVTGLLDDLKDGMKDEEGQDLVEYAVLVGFIGIAAAVALFALMPNAMNTMRDKIQACLTFNRTNCTLS